MKKLKLGVLGVSSHFILRVLNPLQKSKYVEVYAIASRNFEKVKGTAEKYNIPVYYDSYEKLLEDKEIEAVYIPLPNHLHAQWIKKSADAGKHIICEKPLTLNTDEAKEVVDYAKMKGVLLMEAFMYRFQPKWQKVKEIIQYGEIGKVKAIHTVFNYNNTDSKNIRNIKEYGGGALMDIGCYSVNTARYIMGQEPKRVFGMMKYDEDFGIDILTSGILDFGGAQCMFTVSTQAFTAQSVEILGQKGTIKIPLAFNQYPDVKAKIYVTTGLGERVVEFNPCDQYGVQFEEFAKSLGEGRKEPILPYDAVNNMKVIDAIVSSSRKEQWVELEK